MEVHPKTGLTILFNLCSLLVFLCSLLILCIQIIWFHFVFDHHIEIYFTFFFWNKAFDKRLKPLWRNLVQTLIHILRPNIREKEARWWWWWRRRWKQKKMLSFGWLRFLILIQWLVLFVKGKNANTKSGSLCDCPSESVCVCVRETEVT